MSVDERSRERRGRRVPRQEMKPAPFEYFRPRSLDEALALLAEHGGDAKPLAGGQSLIPAMNFRLATPSVLVDLNGSASSATSRMAEATCGLAA